MFTSNFVKIDLFFQNLKVDMNAHTQNGDPISLHCPLGEQIRLKLIQRFVTCNMYHTCFRRK